MGFGGATPLMVSKLSVSHCFIRKPVCWLGNAAELSKTHGSQDVLSGLRTNTYENA